MRTLRFATVILWGRAFGFWYSERRFDLSEPVFELFVGEGPGPASGVDSGGLCSGASEGGDERWDLLGVLVGQVGAFALAKCSGLVR